MTPNAVEDPPLERQRRARAPRRRQEPTQRGLRRHSHRMVLPALRFLVISVILAVPAVVLIVLGHGWSVGLGVALLLVASAPAVVASALLASASVVRWAARRKPFA